MNILSAQGLCKAHGVKQLFSDLTFGIDERDRVGIIGANGSGKSTLLRIIAGVEPADKGIVARRQDLRIEFLDQKPHFEPGRAVLDHVLQGEGELMSAVRDYERTSARLEAHPDDDSLMRAMEDLNHRMDTLGGWEVESRARIILSRLGIHDLEKPVESLSGGYRKRVALARALLAPCDLLILDEPTNHLDTAMIAWLEEYLQRLPGAVVLVTHDRYFLDRITRVIFELDRGAIGRFEGNFSYYLEKKAELEEMQASADQRRKGILRNELIWLKRGARARTTKQKARIDRYFDLKDQVVDRTRETLSFKSGARRLGGKILEIEGVSKSMGNKPCVVEFSHTMAKGERMGIIGPNGCGKTTLVNLITGSLKPDSGTIEIGSTVKFGYYDQESRGLDPNERAIDYVKREGGEMLQSPDGGMMTAAAVMELFLFTPQMLYSPIAKLSGGEQRRLYLVRTLMRDPNFLILDEPTNDLDIATLQALENYLDGFGGCLLVISHDRYFIDRTVDCVFANEGDGVWTKYPGGYAVYAEMKADRKSADRAAAAEPKAAPAAQAAEPAPAKAPAAKGEAPAKLSFKEQRELADREAEIAKLEARLEAIQTEMAAAAGNYPKVEKLALEQHEKAAALETAMARWETLASRAEAAKQK